MEALHAQLLTVGTKHALPCQSQFVDPSFYTDLLSTIAQYKSHVTSSCVCPMPAGGLYCSIQRTVSECFGNKWIYSPIGPDIRDTDKQKTEWQFLTEELKVTSRVRAQQALMNFWNGWMGWPNLRTPHTALQQDSIHTCPDSSITWHPLFHLTIPSSGEM